MVSIRLSLGGNYTHLKRERWEQLNELLITMKIPFSYCAVKDIGIEAPYLEVDGVPLDYERALKFIDEQSMR